MRKLSITEDQFNNLMDMLKIPEEKRNFKESKGQIETLIYKNEKFQIYEDKKLQPFRNCTVIEIRLKLLQGRRRH